MALSKITNASVADNAVHGRRNLLINSGFKVAQRGTSFTSSSVNEYSLDRWRTEGYALSTVISQQSFIAGQTDVPDFPTNYVRVTTNTAIPSGQFWSFQQRIEKPQVIPIGTQNFTLSFWVKSVSGTISASAFSFGIGGNKVNCPEITTSWQKITTTINRAVSSSNAYESMYLVHLPAGASAISVDIANVQLEIGEQATPFEHRSHGEELAACQRFFCKSYNQDRYPGNNVSPATVNIEGAAATGNGQSTANRPFQSAGQYPVTMRTKPTITLYHITGTSGKITGGSFAAYDGSAVNIGDRGFNFHPTGNVSNSDNEDHYAIFTADAEL
mgnify:CR=1 FL=1